MKLNPQRKQKRHSFGVTLRRLFRISASLIVVSGVIPRNSITANEKGSGSLHIDTQLSNDSSTDDIESISIDTQATIDSIKAEIVLKKREIDSLHRSISGEEDDEYLIMELPGRLIELQ